MNNADVLDVMKLKGVEALHHANSVQTSCTFLRSGALLSRHAVEQRKLEQTAQSSDQADRAFGVWGDVFLDGVDIHARASRKNHYGPVLFVLDLESVLRSADLEGSLRITRENPIYWKAGQTEEGRYFMTKKDLAESYSYGDFGKMFTFRLAEGAIPLKRYLLTVVLDDPSIPQDKEVFERAKDALVEAAKTSGIKLEVTRRSCSGFCRCKETYKRGWAWSLKKMFAA